MTPADAAVGAPGAAVGPGRARWLVSIAPGLFVFLWSTGFVAARYATRDAGPLTFLTVRLVVAGSVLAAVAVATRAPRLDRRTAGWVSLAGLGMHAIYLGGVFLAIDHGLPSGLVALIAGLHPVVTSLAARGTLGERLAPVQWAGVALGFAGVAVVVIDHLAESSGGVSAGPLLPASLAVLGIAGGTLLQRRHGSAMPLLWGTVAQYAASAAVLGVGAVAVEHVEFDVTVRSIFALVWSVGVLSIAAVMIMLWLLQRHAASRVSSLFFLTPALSTIEGAVLFDESVGLLAVVGLAVALAGVALVSHSRV